MFSTLQVKYSTIPGELQRKLVERFPKMIEFITVNGGYSYTEELKHYCHLLHNALVHLYLTKELQPTLALLPEILAK